MAAPTSQRFHPAPPSAGPATLPFATVRLRCPDCRVEPAFTPTPTQPFVDGAFGVLDCRCSSYPVLDDIPILRHGPVGMQNHLTGRTEVDGPTTASLVALLRADRGLDALVEMLASPPPVPFGLGRRPGLRLPFTRGPWPLLALRARREEVRGMLADLDGLTAQDWLELTYGRSSERISGDLLSYFLVRYGQPRQLATFSLLRTLPEDPRPILDLACGAGHQMYHLAVREQPRASVGVDRNFVQLWIGRRYIAPMQTWVCADRPDALPFDDDAFSAAVCTDAFHYFPDQAGAADEMRRVAVDGTVVIDRIANALLPPDDGAGERDPAGYLALFRGAPARMAAEDELVEHYRAGRGPQLAAPRDPSEFARHKWLAVVSSADPRVLVDHGPFDEPPHAAGALRLNPVYAVTRHDDVVHLDFAFPTTWYAFENHAMLRYTSPGERLDAATFDALAAGTPTPGADELVDRFVLLGMPPDHARRPGTPPRFRSIGAGLRDGVRRGLRAHLTHRRRPSARRHPESSHQDRD